MSILSVQSHVAYGYVGNKAAVYPLQSMGYDVWPVNTVQFSNHTGYGKWQGEIFSGQHIKDIVKGMEDIGVINKCQAVLSGYMGSAQICEAVFEIVDHLKEKNANLLYLCDPVIGNTHCFVKPEVLTFFKTRLRADIITPNQFEAETLSGIKISNMANLKLVSQYFHSLGIKTVVITGLRLSDIPAKDLHISVSDSKTHYLIKTRELNLDNNISGTGDLFSALYLGNYILTGSIIKALQMATCYMEEVIHNTLQAQSNELQVTSVDYREPDIKILPEFIII